MRIKFEKGFIVLEHHNSPEKRRANRAWAFAFGILTLWCIFTLESSVLTSRSITWITVESIFVLLALYLTASTCYLGWFRRKGKKVKDDTMTQLLLEGEEEDNATKP